MASKLKKGIMISSKITRRCNFCGFPGCETNNKCPSCGEKDPARKIRPAKPGRRRYVNLSILERSPDAFFD